MFGTNWVCESTFATVNFRNSKYRSSILNKNYVQIKISYVCKIYTTFQIFTMNTKNGT